MSKGFTEFEGFDPRSRQMGVFRLVMDEIDRISRYQPSQKLHDLHCVSEIIGSPQVAFQGLRTVDDKFGDKRQYVELPESDGLCIAGIPSRRILADGNIVRPHEGYTFAIFTDSRLTVKDWDWIRNDIEYPHRPIGWSQRFNELIWSKS